MAALVSHSLLSFLLHVCVLGILEVFLSLIINELCFVVPTERLELSQGCPYTLLKRARLPIPPRRLGCFSVVLSLSGMNSAEVGLPAFAASASLRQATAGKKPAIMVRDIYTIIAHFNARPAEFILRGL